MVCGSAHTHTYCATTELAKDGKRTRMELPGARRSAPTSPSRTMDSTPASSVSFSVSFTWAPALGGDIGAGWTALDAMVRVCAVVVCRACERHTRSVRPTASAFDRRCAVSPGGGVPPRSVVPHEGCRRPPHRQRRPRPSRQFFIRVQPSVASYIPFPWHVPTTCIPTGGVVTACRHHARMCDVCVMACLRPRVHVHRVGRRTEDL